MGGFQIRAVAWTALCAVAGCAPPPPRYIITASPINLGVVSQPLCIALDPTDPEGIWWWEPSVSGCSGRSSNVLRADSASVTPGSAPGIVDAAFRIQLHSAPGSNVPDFADLRLVFEQSMIRSPQSRVVVSTDRRADLEVPEEAPPPRKPTLELPASVPRPPTGRD